MTAAPNTETTHTPEPEPEPPIGEGRIAAYERAGAARP